MHQVWLVLLRMVSGASRNCVVTLKMGSEVPGKILEGRSKEAVPRLLHGPEDPQDARGPHFTPPSLF